MTEQKRVILDCRQHPKSNCTLTLSGTEQEVLDAGEQHAIGKHGFEQSPGLRDQLRQYLKQEALSR